MPTVFRLVGLTAVLAMLTLPRVSRAGDEIEIGSGWEDMGAIDGGPKRYLEWMPSLQGSRKDVPAFFGYRRVGTTRVYWAPYARLNYTNFWSIGGSGNLLGVTIAPAGLGVYLSELPSPIPEERIGHWYAVAEINVAAVQLGGNITPNGPKSSQVPDPNAYRAKLKDDIQNKGGVQTSTFLTQYYPFGQYAFAQLNAPIQIRVWNMITAHEGVGFFIEGYPMMFEWQLPDGTSRNPAYGYSVTAGASMTFF